MRSLRGLAALLLLAAPAAAIEIEVVARTGDAAPGTAAGVVFTSFDPTILIDSRRRLLFSATLDGVGVSNGNDRGLWRGAPGSLGLVAREGSLAVGIAATQYGSFYHPVGQTPTGAYAFRATVSSPPGSTPVWFSTGSGLDLLRRPGQPAVGTPGGVTFDNLIFVGIGNSGGVALLATLAGPGVDATNDWGLWKRDASSFSLLARKGAPAPGIIPATTITGLFEPAIGANGTIAYVANLSGGGSAIYVDPGSGPVLRHQSGDLLPDGSGDAFISFFNPLVDRAGRIAFQAFVDSAGDHRAILRERPGALDVVARTGGPAPGAGAGVTYQSVSSAQLGAGGALLFLATLQGASVTNDTNRAIYRDLGAGPEPIVREGDFAGFVPGAGLGLSPTSFGDYFEMAISDGGRVLVRNLVVGPAPSANSVLFWFGRDGSRSRLLRTGTNVAVAPGELRTISSLQVAGLAPPRRNGQGHGVTERRAAAFVGFTDGTQAILLVPEPATAEGAAIAALIALAAARCGARERASG